MKGVEFPLLLALIAALIVLVIFAIIVFVPFNSNSNQSNQYLSFKQVCVFWSTNSPAYSGDTTTINGEPVKLAPFCACELGIPTSSCTSVTRDTPNLSLDQWNACRNDCRGIS